LTPRAAALLLLSACAGGRVPPMMSEPVLSEPGAVAAFTVRHPGGDEPVSLRLAARWEGSSLGPAATQLDPVSTALTPTVLADPGHTAWLFAGVGVFPHDDLGAVRVLYHLLLERDPSGALTGFWHEDRMAVPTTLYDVVAEAQGHALRLQLTERVDGDVPAQRLVAEGLVRPPLGP